MSVHAVLMSVLLLATILCDRLQAGLPISVRLVGGVSNSTHSSTQFDSRGLILSAGAGLVYDLSARHAVFIDIESMERHANQSPRVSGVTSVQEAPFVRLRYTPITIGYRYTLNPNTRRYTFWLIGGYGIGPITQYDSYVRYSGNVPPDPANTGDPTFKGDRRWKSGAVIGAGGAVTIEKSVRLGTVVQYRFMHYQAYHMLPQNIEPPPVSSLPVLSGGIEAKLVVELHL